jgi:hypothetical protein
MEESGRLSELSMTELVTHSNKMFHEDPESELANLGPYTYSF